MGAEAARKVKVADNIVLDFTGLFADTAQKKQPATSPVEPLLRDGQYKTLASTEKPVEGHIGGLESIPAKEPPEIPAKTLLLQTQREQEDHKRTLEAYRHYQDNIRKSEQLQSEILKGIKAGEDVYSLFLKAAKAISLMTSNSVFYSQIEDDTRSIYGRGLNYKPPLQNELQDTQKRLQRLLEAEQREADTDSRERIKRAVKAHREHIAELEAMIARAEKTQL